MSDSTKSISVFTPTSICMSENEWMWTPKLWCLGDRYQCCQLSNFKTYCFPLYSFYFMVVASYGLWFLWRSMKFCTEWKGIKAAPFFVQNLKLATLISVYVDMQSTSVFQGLCFSSHKLFLHHHETKCVLSVNVKAANGLNHFTLNCLCAALLCALLRVIDAGNPTRLNDYAHLLAIIVVDSVPWNKSELIFQVIILYFTPRNKKTKWLILKQDRTKTKRNTISCTHLIWLTFQWRGWHLKPPSQWLACTYFWLGYTSHRWNWVSSWQEPSVLWMNIFYSSLVGKCVGCFHNLCVFCWSFFY